MSVKRVSLCWSGPAALSRQVKNNSPILTPEIENRLHHYLQHRVLETRGVLFHEIGGTADQIHLAVSIPPTLLISEWVGKLKGASSHYINHEIVNRGLGGSGQRIKPLFSLLQHFTPLSQGSALEKGGEMKCCFVLRIPAPAAHRT
jgi:REP element-mobilizing transposase RayT